MTSSPHARLWRNSAMNLAGYGVPAVVGIVVFPFLLRILGTEQFGVLSLLWVTVAYFNLLDLGIGRALTRSLADCLAMGRMQDIAAQAAAGVLFMLCMGIMGGAVVYAAAPWLVVDVLRLPQPIQGSSVAAFRALALAMPSIVSVPGLHAILASHGRFDLINGLRIPATTLMFLSPVLGLKVHPTLVGATGAIACAYWIGWLGFLVACFRVVPSLRRPRKPSRHQLTELLRYGGWLTVSNVIGPVLLYVDRFVIARMVSPAAVAFYSAPFSVATQLWMVPRAVIDALFPALVTDLSSGGDGARATYYRGTAYVIGVLAPAAAILALGAKAGLSLWLGAEFASHSYRVAQILVVAVAINATGLVATAVVQAAGRPDLTAKLHLIEAPIYFVYLGVLMSNYGIVGAAVAWLLRVTGSAIVLTVVALRCIDYHGRATRSRSPAPVAAPVHHGATV